MVSAVGAASTASGNQPQIAALEKQLVQDEKQLSSDETSGNSTSAQLVAIQTTLLESEIAQLSKAAESGAATPKALGNSIDVSV